MPSADTIFPALRPSVKFRYYLTAFVDLLGLSNRLLDVDALFRDGLEGSEQLALIRASVGEIYRLRQGFESFYTDDSGVDIRASIPVQDFETESLLATIADRRSLTIFQYVSDCVIISVPIDMGELASTLAAVSRLVSSCASASMALFCYQQLCRGGMEVGVSGEPFDGEVLGASLAAAHRLESEVASYPRIVVGQHALAFLRMVAANKDSSRSARFAKGMATSTLELLREDDDGQWYVDFLRRDHVEMVAGLGLGTQFQLAKTFVLRERRRLQQDPTLRSKYEWLDRYVGRSGL